MSQLDVGNYPTKPRLIGNAKNLKQARVREAQRLADFVALPSEADPTYTDNAVGPFKPRVVLNRKGMGDLVINDTFDEVAKDLVAGWTNAMATDAADPDAPRRILSIAVLEFPEAKIASSVGPALEHDDFTYNPENQPVEIPKYKDAKAHWRPNVSSIGSWTVHDRYVIFIKVVDDTSAPDLPALVSQVERMLDVQIPLLNKFVPTPSDQLEKIPLDPGGLLGRTLPTSSEEQLRADPDGVYTGRGVASGMKEQNLDFMKDGDIDLVAFGDGAVFRSRSEKGALALWNKWRPSTRPEPDQKLVAAPKGLGSHVECYADLSKDGAPIMNLCVLQVDRYVVQTAGKQLQNLHQKTAAQYALLTAE
ncbi:DUF7373 family lipoprotein [Nocardia transvalensis]|uniref:DUF7373 family lipoprotein n=1 Tax=Nocardia transvalensis TaxID=37333 RepID=UPI002B4B746B|nr:hypothetical protein [Nocardia transvalensis]